MQIRSLSLEGLTRFDEQCHRYQQKEKKSEAKHELLNLFIKVQPQTRAAILYGLPFLRDICVTSVLHE